MSKSKPLASITFGKAIQGIRRQLPRIGSSTEEAAETLCIGGSTLRMLEAGLLTPPYSLAGSLAKEYGLSFSATAVVLGFIHSVDHCPYKVMVEEARYFEKSVPRLRFFAKRLVKAAGLAGMTAFDNGAEVMRDAALVEELSSFLLQPFHDEAGIVISPEMLRDLAIDNSTIAFLRHVLVHKRSAG